MSLGVIDNICVRSCLSEKQHSPSAALSHSPCNATVSGENGENEKGILRILLWMVFFSTVLLFILHQIWVKLIT